MATARVDHVYEHFVLVPASDDNGTPIRTGLVVHLDLDDDRRRIHVAILLFATFAGLEAEFDAGVATTVLDAAIDTYLAAMTDAEPLPAAAAGFIATAITY